MAIKTTIKNRKSATTKLNKAVTAPKKRKSSVSTTNVTLPNTKDIFAVEVIDLIVTKGYSTSKVIEHIKKEQQVGERQAYKILKYAKEQLAEVYSEIKGNALFESLLFLETLKSQAFEDGDIKTTLEVQKELNKLNQLHTIKTEITVKTEQPLFSETDLDVIDIT